MAGLGGFVPNELREESKPILTKRIVEKKKNRRF